MKTNGNDHIKEKLIKHMLSLSFLGSIVLWTLYVCIHDLFVSKDLFDVLEGISELKDWVRISFWGFFQVYPLILTVLNIMFLRSKSKDKLWKRKEKQIEFITLTLGPIVSFFLCYYMEITSSDWTETLINAEKHIPIWTGGLLTVIVLSMIGVVGYLYLSVTKVYRVPPLLSVGAIAAVYIGMGMCIFWIIHIFPLQELVISRFDIFRVWTFYLVLFPLNCLILGAKLIRSKVREWNENQPGEIRQFRISFLNQLNEKLKKADDWPLAAFLFMWPLLGLIIIILILFGQRPDSVIKAWTETSDWNLSMQTAPPNLMVDEHYLCTVAAGGHAGIVKPLRMGERRGHRVVVNRQLCIANAFEQVIEERMPGFHRHLRHFYDTYGFPVARLIRTKTAADVVYVLMKPLEWLFLIVLYATDVNPENRIAVQYLPKKGIEPES